MKIYIRVGKTNESRLTPEQKDKINQHWIEKDLSIFLKGVK